MILEIFGIFLFFAVFLLTLGLLKKQYIILMLSGVFFLILGIYFTTGIEYKSGSVVNQINTTHTEIINQYVEWNDNLVQYPTTALLFLFGLFILTVSWIKIFGISIGANLINLSDGGDDNE